MLARLLWWSAAVGAVVILAAALVVLVVPEPVPPGREVLGRVVGGDEILRGPDLLRVQVDRADGADPHLRVPVDDLLPVGTEVRLRVTPDGNARLSGPDSGRNPPSGRSGAATAVALAALTILGSMLLVQAAQRREAAAATAASEVHPDTPS